jgi:hypothetical protein
MLLSAMEHRLDIPQNSSISMDHYGYSSLPHQPAGIILHSLHQVASISTSTASSNSSSSTSTPKRGRPDLVETNDASHQRATMKAPTASYEETPLVSVAPKKKARSCTYEAPKVVKPSILTALGTLAANGAPGSISGGTVPVRRRLSGGHLEEFLGTHDHNMEMDTSDFRPRSMSF